MTLRGVECQLNQISICRARTSISPRVASIKLDYIDKSEWSADENIAMFLSALTSLWQMQRHPATARRSAEPLSEAEGKQLLIKDLTAFGRGLCKPNQISARRLRV
jgi:hypothetical protein